MMHATQASSSSPGEAVAFTVFVLEGKDGAAALTIDERGTRSVVVGSSAVCTMTLADPSVSHCHARLEICGSILSIRDLGAGSVVVNGATVKEAFLRGGEIIRLGATLLSVRRHAPAEVWDELLPSAFGTMIGDSVAMRRCFRQLAEVAALDVPVLLIGEEGAGKEAAARGIHRSSARALGPFVELHPGAAPDVRSLSALVALARGGSLFVDGPAALSMDAQRALHDLLEASHDVRVLSAAWRPLSCDVGAGRMDAAFARRLGAATVVLPPLREREGDVAVLAHAFWCALLTEGEPDGDDDDDGQLPNDFLARFEGYDWPGNVRELRAALLARRTMGAFSPARQRRAKAEDADALLEAILDEGIALPAARRRILHEFEGRFAVRALARNGTVGRAARAAGMAARRLRLIAAQGEWRSAG